MKIPVNPRLPKNFGSTPNAERPEADIRKWWCTPYVVNQGERWDVYCLDGGAWDRPTWHATKSNQEDAVAYAEKLHAIYWSQPSSNELPVPFPYEMRLEPLGNTGALSARLVGPAEEAMALKQSEQA